MLWGRPQTVRMANEPDDRLLFGRRPADWTKADLAELPGALLRCERIAKSHGASLGLDWAEIDATQAVRQAWVERDRRAVEAEARERVAREEARQKAEAAARDRIAAEERRRTAEAERVRVRETETQEAGRLEADIAAAEARRDTELARQRIADAQVRAKRAAAEAVFAREAADRSEREAAVTMPTPEAPKQGSNAPPGPTTRLAGEAGSVPVDARPTFAFSASEFRVRYDRQLAADRDGGIRSCEVVGNLHRCRFDEGSFRKSVDAFKTLDLANGDFVLKASVSIGTVGDRVARIVVRGDRSDPMNLFAAIGKIGSLVKTLQPGVSEDEVALLLTGPMGLMGGDDDPAIGEERMEIRPTFVITCRQALSRISTGITCRFEPRS